MLIVSFRGVHFPDQLLVGWTKSRQQGLHYDFPFSLDQAIIVCTQSRPITLSDETKSFAKKKKPGEIKSGRELRRKMDEGHLECKTAASHKEEPEANRISSRRTTTCFRFSHAVIASWKPHDRDAKLPLRDRGILPQSKRKPVFVCVEICQRDAYALRVNRRWFVSLLFVVSFWIQAELQRIRFGVPRKSYTIHPCFLFQLYSIGTKVGISLRIQESVLQRPSLCWFSYLNRTIVAHAAKVRRKYPACKHLAQPHLGDTVISIRLSDLIVIPVAVAHCGIDQECCFDWNSMGSLVFLTCATLTGIWFPALLLGPHFKTVKQCKEPVGRTWLSCLC